MSGCVSLCICRLDSKTEGNGFTLKSLFIATYSSKLDNSGWRETKKKMLDAPHYLNIPNKMLNKDVSSGYMCKISDQIRLKSV